MLTDEKTTEITETSETQEIAALETEDTDNQFYPLQTSTISDRHIEAAYIYGDKFSQARIAEWGRLSEKMRREITVTKESK